MMANLETFVMSPNRPAPVVTQTADELVKNYVSRVPEMNVTFGCPTDDGENGTTVNFSTSENAKLDQHGSLEHILHPHRSWNSLHQHCVASLILSIHASLILSSLIPVPLYLKTLV